MGIKNPQQGSSELPDGTAGTLGHILFSGRPNNLVSEASWAALVQSIAEGEQLALHALYERAHRPVFTLIMRIVRDREITEELTIDSFHDIWQKAASYGPVQGPVLGWIMRLARSKAIEQIRSNQGTETSSPHVDSSLNPHPERQQDDLSVDLLLALSLQGRLARRLATEARGAVLPTEWQWSEPEWEEVSSGIFCKLLATDKQKHNVSMLVRLAQGVEYPPHSHAGVEELHLLEGELWINDRKLFAGDYHRAEADSTDHRVWSRTGCMCVMTTSTDDRII